MKFSSVLACSLALVTITPVLAENQKEDKKTQKTQTVQIADGKLTLTIPKEWRKKEGAGSQFIDHEFSFPADAKEGDPTVRITISRAGGGVDANIKRWKGQFTKTDKSSVEKFEAAGKKVVIADLQGEFADKVGNGPPIMRKTVIRKDYRMLGAIVDDSNFIKLVGPKDLVAKLAEGTKKALKDLTAK